MITVEGVSESHFCKHGGHAEGEGLLTQRGQLRARDLLPVSRCAVAIVGTQVPGVS